MKRLLKFSYPFPLTGCKDSFPRNIYLTSFLSLLNTCHFVGTEQFYKRWPFVLSRQPAGKCNASQNTIIVCLYCQDVIYCCEQQCSSYQLFTKHYDTLTWLLVQCIITDALVKDANRGNATKPKSALPLEYRPTDRDVF